MIAIPSGVRVWLASGHTDMRKGFEGLALLVQETLKRNPHGGHLFVFRGRRGGLIKVRVMIYDSIVGDERRRFSPRRCHGPEGAIILNRSGMQVAVVND